MDQAKREKIIKMLQAHMHETELKMIVASCDMAYSLQKIALFATDGDEESARQLWKRGVERHIPEGFRPDWSEFY